MSFSTCCLFKAWLKTHIPWSNDWNLIFKRNSLIVVGVEISTWSSDKQNIWIKLLLKNNNNKQGLPELSLAELILIYLIKIIWSQKLPKEIIPGCWESMEGCPWWLPKIFQVNLNHKKLQWEWIAAWVCHIFGRQTNFLASARQNQYTLSKNMKKNDAPPSRKNFKC